MMVRIEDIYFRLNRILFFAIGGWYTQTSIFALFYRIIGYIILITFTIVQLMVIVTSKCDMVRLIKVISIICASLCLTVEYHSILMNRGVVKDLLTRIQRIYDETKNEKEIAIFHKHAHISERYNILFIAFLLCAVISVTVTQFWSIILDIVLPLNESRPHRLLIEVEYFVDQEKYFYLILLHIGLAIIIGITSAASLGTAFVSYYYCICSFLRIVSCRIEQVMKGDALKNTKKNEKRLKSAIRVHRKVTELAKCLLSDFEMCLLFITTLRGFMCSLYMFQLLQIVLHEDDIENAVIPLALIIGLFSYCFIINYIGQQIIDDNNNVFITAYDVRWYDTSLRIQRLILFLLQRGNKSFSLDINGLMVLSLETFAMIVSTTISYFTVFCSLRS